MDIAVRGGLVQCAFEDEMVPEEACGETAAGPPGAEGAESAGEFRRGDEGRGLGAEGDRAAECAVAVGGGTDAALDLDTPEERGVGVHISPEDGLVFRRIERHTVEGDVDAGAAGTADAHVTGAGPDAVLAPGEDAGGAGEKCGQFLSGVGEGFQGGAVDVGHGEGRVLGSANGADDHLLELLDEKRVGDVALSGLLGVEGCD